MPLTYATERAVFFNPMEVRPRRCLKCGTACDRISPRMIAARELAGFNRIRVRRMSRALTLCQRCDNRWAVATYLGSALALMPLWIIPVMVFFTVQHDYLPIQALVGAFIAAFPIAIGSYIWARTKLIQVDAIDEDGLIGLRNVHPDARDAIVAIGEQR